jgi:transcriptional regulator with PAS, ATPase and Fis domain
MKLGKIMKSRPDPAPVLSPVGLSVDRDIYDLNPDDLEPFGALVPIVDERRRVVGDIKKERLMNVVRLKGHELMSEIMDQFSEGVIAAAADGIIFYVNEMYNQIFEVPVGKVLGRNVFETEPNSALVRVLNQKKLITLDKQYVETIDKYVSCRISPIIVSGHFKGAVSVFSDASELVALGHKVRHAEQVANDLRERMDSLTEVDQMKIIGQSPAFIKVLSQAAIVAQTLAPVLILGENGVGKEVIANFIHRHSDRADQPLIVVNCASIPENLIESELFGYESGSFTGARRGGKMGKFEMADGGTLFLDEIGDMSLAAQTKVLRAIQEKEIARIGGERSVKVDVRIIAATNQNLNEMIADRQFRRDLFYRINTVTLKIPSLRERKEDLPIFANDFLLQFNAKYHKQVRFPGEVLSYFYRYHWPGNVRELKNCIENGVIMAQGQLFELSHLTQSLEDFSPAADQTVNSETISSPPSGSLKDALEKTEKDYLLQALKICDGHRLKAMRLLGLSKRTFYRKMRYYSLTA